MRPTVSETLYRDSHRQLLGYVRSRVTNAEDAEDIVQSLYLKLYRAVERGRRIERPEAFLFAAARNAVIDHYRTRRHYVELPELRDERHAGDDDAAAESREIMTGWMRPLIEELEEPYRTTLRMSELQERPYREIAQELGIGLSAVKSRVRRGRERMRASLLACCRFAFDAAGRVVDYEPKRSAPDRRTQPAHGRPRGTRSVSGARNDPAASACADGCE